MLDHRYGDTLDLAVHGSNDPDGCGFFAGFDREVCDHGFTVVIDESFLSHRAHHPLQRGARDTGAEGNLPRRRRLMIVPEKVIHKADDPVHVAHVPVFHALLHKSELHRSVLIDYNIAHFSGISRLIFRPHRKIPVGSMDGKPKT